jgi:Spy/CpxP family protein refolding chaperone
VFTLVSQKAGNQDEADDGAKQNGPSRKIGKRRVRTNMNVRKRIINSMLTTTFGTALLFAQGPPAGSPPNGGNPPDPAAMISRRVGRLTTVLGLTDAQQQQATKIFTDAATKASTIFTSMRSARTDLKTAIQQNNLNNINLAATTIGNLTVQMTVAEALAQASFYAILTPDQQAKVNQLESQRPGMFGGGPPAGGPGMGQRMGPGPR